MMNLLFKTLTFLLLFGCSNKSDSTDSVKELNPITWSDCSQTIGSHPCNFTLKDQNNKDWSLYDHYGSIIVIDFSTEWCGYCQVAASTAQSLQDEYEDKDVIYVTIMVEDSAGNPGSYELAKKWAEYFGIDAPVLAGNRSMIDASGMTGWPISGWPKFFFIDQYMILRSEISGYSEHAIKHKIEEIYNSID